MSERAVSCCVLWLVIPKANSHTTLGHCCSFTSRAGRAAEGPGGRFLPVFHGIPRIAWIQIARALLRSGQACCGFQFRQHTISFETVSNLSRNFIPMPESWSNRNESRKVHGEQAPATSRSNSQRSFGNFESTTNFGQPRLSDFTYF